ncbi:hypothetical protein BDDG_13429, partial [Blastomyces dermatitidis ATCC 18188]
TEQFISKSSHVDRFMSADDSEPDVTFLIKNLKNMIMKKLSMLYVAESSVFSLAPSTASFSAASLSVSFSAASQSSILIPVSDSPAPAISVPVILTSATSDFAVSAFVISSSHFKKMLHRLDESCFSVCILSFFLLTFRMIYYIKTAKDICVFRNENADVVLFYTHRFASASEIILIEDDNTAETTLSHSQASSITFSFFSAEKVVHTLNY